MNPGNLSFGPYGAVLAVTPGAGLPLESCPVKATLHLSASSVVADGSSI